MNIVAFTICSINYLAQAKTLGDSLLKHNPDFKFYIGLVDKLELAPIEPTKLPDYEIVEVEKIGIEAFDEMYERYNITELNTAVKPFFLEYFYNTISEVDSVIYFDPDIEIFQPLTSLEKSLQNYQIVITPHTLSPYPDGLNPKERDLLNTGIFNLGFIATARGLETIEFLKWWQQKLRYECFIDLANGMFVDQLWINFVPAYWSNVLIDKGIGSNMAYWNLHERKLTGKLDGYTVNEIEPLVFFHYSGYSPLKPNEISKYQNRYNFETRSEIKSLFDNYANTLNINGYEYFQQFACAYMKPPAPWVPPSRGQRPRKWAVKQLEKLIGLINNF